jgi:hypothetical protein
MLGRTVNSYTRGVACGFALALTVAVGALAPAARAQSTPGQGPGGPILVVVDSADPFGRYYAEILHAEGLNEFTVADIGSVTPTTLAGADVVLLAQMGLSPPQVAMFTSYVGSGGNLIAMRPDKQLAPLLGLADAGATLSNAYLQVDTGRPPGAGITGATMQYHDTADRYALAGATPVATLFANASAPTDSPAVTLRAAGAGGGEAAAFTYDLARSVVQTRQGDPARAGQETDGLAPIRSDDLFFPDWVDFLKIAIPQADEQQRLLANLITQMTIDRAPLPRFWYLPRGAKAAVVMTGDDHALSQGGTTGQFERFKAESPAGCSVADWQCVRSTSYVYKEVNAGLTDAQAAAYQAQGFEIALHYKVSGAVDCNNFTSASALDADLTAQLQAFAATWPSLAASRTNRTHCIVWSDWSSEAAAERAHGIRLDTTYYYWPATWVQNRPGLFTGSGFPMRFAAANGDPIDVYQAATQITDESGMDIPAHIRALLDRAVGPEGYYGVITANMHTDQAVHPGADAIVAAAQTRGVPVVSAVQMLDWLDGRDGSSFEILGSAGGQLRFRLHTAAGSRGLQAMLPAASAAGALQNLTRDGQPVALNQRTVKGISYLVFDAVPGDYVAIYPVPAGGGPVGRTPAPRRPRVKVKLLSRRVSKRGTLTFRVTCPSALRRCKVRMVLNRGKSRAGRASLTVRGGKSVKVKVRLTTNIRRLLARRHRLTLKASIAATYADGSRSRQTLRLKIRRR